MSKPELTIPIALDSAKAIAELKRLQEMMDNAGEEGKKAGKKASSGFDGFGKIGDEIAGMATRMVSVGAAVGAVTSLWSTYSAGVQKTVDNIAKMSKEFTDFRNKVSESAGVQGVAPSNDFTLKQIGLAEQAKVSPEQFRQFQQSMNEQIAGNIGEGRQLTQEQADTITQKAAQFGTARGISADAIATLIGGLTRQTKAGPNADKEILDKFGKLINLMDASPGKVERLLPELNEVMAGGTDYQEAGAIISTMAARGRPGEAGTYGRAMQRAIAQLMVDVKGGKRDDALGVTMEMSDTEAAKSIYDSAIAQGVDVGNERAVKMWLAEKGFTASEERDALSAMFNLGIKGGGVANARETISKGGIGAVQKSIDNYMNEDVGKRNAEVGRKEAERLRQGVKMSGFDIAKEQAEADLTKEGRFTNWTNQDTLNDWMTNDSVYGNRETMLVNQRALQNLHYRARELGVPKEQLPYQAGAFSGAPFSLAQTQSAAEEYLRIIAEATQKQAEQNANKPLAAPPPQPQLRQN